MDSLHYDIDTTITAFENLIATTRLQFHVLMPSLRLLPIRLADPLTVETRSLRSSDGKSIGAGVIQDEKVSAVFQEPLREGDLYTLELRYSGKEILFDIGMGRYYVLWRTNWYPNTAAFTDRATYNLTYRTGRGSQIFSVGKRVEEYKKDGKKISRWVSEEPLTVAGFNYGKYLTHSQKDDLSGIRLSLCYTIRTPEKVLRSIMADCINSARLFSHYFGPLPYSHIMITEQSQGFFGQEWPALVFLPSLSFLNRTVRSNLGLRGSTNDFFDYSITPHELAHQWWGHQITAKPYRDQWLEEGFAEFSAALLIQMTQGWKVGDDYFRDLRELVTAKTTGSRVPNYQSGPITQGWRLITRKSRSAYRAIVYGKGAYVPHMLRMLMYDQAAGDPDERFRKMIRDCYQSNRGRTVCTADF